jgi:hypothetical protein
MPRSPGRPKEGLRERRALAGDALKTSGTDGNGCGPFVLCLRCGATPSGLLRPGPSPAPPPGPGRAYSGWPLVVCQMRKQSGATPGKKPPAPSVRKRGAARHPGSAAAGASAARRTTEADRGAAWPPAMVTSHAAPSFTIQSIGVHPEGPQTHRRLAEAVRGRELPEKGRPVSFGAVNVDVLHQSCRRQTFRRHDAAYWCAPRMSYANNSVVFDPGGSHSVNSSATLAGVAVDH